MSVRKVLVLGSGSVAGPCVDYLLRDARNQLTIACRNLKTAENLAHGRPNTTTVSLDASDKASLTEAVGQHDVVISLVPYAYHADVTRAAIARKVNVVTTSYISQAMRSLETEIRSSGIVVLNEVGLDPGIDHCYAIKTIREVQSRGGKVKEYYSFCGGLPAREHATNPLQFKCSWSTKGALQAQNNNAIFLKDGETVEIDKTELMSHAAPYFVMEGYSFMGFPNRNSVPFREFYRIPEARTVIRGTLRYSNNPRLFDALVKLGWLNDDAQQWLQERMTWIQVQARLIGSPDASESSVVAKIEQICQFPDPSVSDKVIAGLRWIGLLSSKPVGQAGSSPLTLLAANLEDKIKFGPDERDLIMLQHKFVVDWADGKTDTFLSTLELFGEVGGYSAMAKSVGLTCGIATQLLLDGHPAFSRVGLWAPYELHMCDPLRISLKNEGIEMIETKL